MKRLTVALFVALIAVPAGAVDLNQKLLSLNGKEFTSPDGSQGITAGAVIEYSLLNQTVSSKADKDKNWYLARKLHDAKPDLTLTPEEIVQISKAVSDTQNTAVYGAVMSVVDPTFPPK